MKLSNSNLGLIKNLSSQKNKKFSLIFSLYLLPLFLFSGLSTYAQSNESNETERVSLRAAEFNGHFYTPPAEWILEKLNAPSPSTIGGPPCSTISVTYTGFTPSSQAAFQAAVDIWETVLSGTVNITIDANWEVLSPGILGSTGSRSERNFPGAPSTDYYAASVANQIAGYDISPGFYDMTMSFSSVYDWYLGTDGNPAFDEYDFVTVVLHEIGHGLGFSSAKKYDSTTGIGSFGVGTSSIPKNYDRFLTSGVFGTDLLDLSGTILGNAIVGNNVYNNSPLAVAANGGAAPRMYAPSTYAGGSSISHWNETTYAAGNPHSLMTPFVGAGEAIHNPGEMTIGLLEDLGWDICYSISEPCLGDTDFGDADMDGTDLVQPISTCTWTDDYSTISNVTVGDEYTFTAIDNDDVDVIYITVRSGTFDGDVIGEGYSPLTVTSNVNGTIFAHYSRDEFCDFTHVGCVTSTVQCITCPHYCVELDMVEGDPCNDGDTASIDDVITADCICQGIQPCLNIIAYTIRTFDGSNQVFTSSCTYEQEYNTFNNVESGSSYTFTSEVDGEAGFITIRSGTFDGPVLGFGYSPVTVVSDTDGSLFAHYTVNGACETGTGCVSISAQCISCPVYCPILELAVGSPCDDGNPSTINDMVTSECNCYGEQPCDTGSLFATRTFDGTDIVVIGSSCNFEGEYNAYQNAELGNQYTFTSTDEGYPGFITVRSGTPDGPILGFGFSPVTVTSDIDGTLYPHFTINGNCDTDIGNCVTTTGQCISCPHYCPDLNLVEGDPCNDGNPDTNNDMITADCNCEGSYPAPANDLCTDATPITVNMPGECPDNAIIGTTLGANDESGFFSCDEFPGAAWPDVFYTFNSGEFGTIFFYADMLTQTDMVIEILSSCNGTTVYCTVGEMYNEIDLTPNTDYILRVGLNTVFGAPGTFNICLSGVYDCPALSANIGDECNDGNSNTINDMVNASCNCVGEIPASGSLSGTATWNNSCGDRNLTLNFYTPGTAILIYTYSTSIDGNGDYSISGIAVGNYDIYAKIDGRLANGYYNKSIIAGSNSLLLGASIAGDLNNNNGINISDFSLMNISFGSSSSDSNYNYLADINCDGNVNIVDFSILNIGFGMIGAQP